VSELVVLFAYIELIPLFAEVVKLVELEEGFIDNC
jgi:hypothetical protein